MSFAIKQCCVLRNTDLLDEADVVLQSPCSVKWYAITGKIAECAMAACAFWRLIAPSGSLLPRTRLLQPTTSHVARFNGPVTCRAHPDARQRRPCLLPAARRTRARRDMSGAAPPTSTAAAADMSSLAREGCSPLFAACCRDRASCNVFVWCPLTSGCASAGNATAPFLSCQLKRQDGISGQPGAQPQAFQRGPPASFVSGATHTHPA